MKDRFEHFTISIFDISHYWNKIASNVMKEHGLRGGYALYLSVLYNSEEEITASKLAELCRRDKSDISRAILAFQEKGILQSYGTSRYRAPLKLTDKGKEIAARLRQQADMALKTAGEGLTDEMRVHIHESLDLIAKNLKQIYVEGLPQE